MLIKRVPIRPVILRAVAEQDDRQTSCLCLAWGGAALVLDIIAGTEQQEIQKPHAQPAIRDSHLYRRATFTRNITGRS